MIRVVIVGQSYIASESRKKLAYLANDPSVTVSLIVPTTWEHESFGCYKFQRDVTDEHVSIFPIPIRRNGRPFAFSYTIELLWKAIQQIKPDIIQAEQEPGSLALLQLGLLARLRRAKLIAFTWENLNYRQPGIRHYLEKIELAWLDYLMVGSTKSAEVFREKGYRGPLAVLPNVGVDPERFAPRPSVGLRQKLELDDKFVVGFVGRLVPEKGCHDLLQAFAQLPENCRLLFVGGGSLRDDLERTARQLKIEPHVIFQAPVSHHQVADYLNVMDCLVLPSRTIPGGWREQFGLVLAQAMACGVPVIGSDSGAIPEVIGDTGMIFQEGNVIALCDRLQRLLLDHVLRNTLSAAGRARVLENYTHQRIVEKTCTIYQELLR